MGDGSGAGHLVWSRSGGPVKVKERGRFAKHPADLLSDRFTSLTLESLPKEENDFFD